MAKSTGNIARVGELLEAGVSPRALRFALISVHYRAGLNYSDESLAAAGAALDRLDAAVAALDAYREDGPGRPDAAGGARRGAREAFGAALDDDLNVSAALAAVFDLVRDLNRRIERRSLSTADAGRALATLRDLDRVLGDPPRRRADGLEPESPRCSTSGRRRAPRATSRPPTGCATSSPARGVAVEDTRDGQRWRRTRGGRTWLTSRSRRRAERRGRQARVGRQGADGRVAGPAADRPRRAGRQADREGRSLGGGRPDRAARPGGRGRPARGRAARARPGGRPARPAARPGRGRVAGDRPRRPPGAVGLGGPARRPIAAARPPTGPLGGPPGARRPTGHAVPWRPLARQRARAAADRPPAAATAPTPDRGGRPPGRGRGRPDRRPTAAAAAVSGTARPPYRGDPRRRSRRPAGRPTAVAAADRGGAGPPAARPWPRPRPGRSPDPWPRPAAALPAPDLLGPDEELVAGRRPVEEVFAAGRTALRLLVVPQRRKALEQLVLHATSLRIPIVEVEGGSLTAMAGFDGHQGVALVVEPRRFATLDDVLARADERDEPPFVLVLDSLEDPQNVGTLLRSAEAAGVHGIVFPTRRQAPLTPAAVKASAGAVEHLLLCPVDDLAGRPRRPPRPRPAGRRRRGRRAADRPSDRPARSARDRRRQRGPGPRVRPSAGAATCSCGSRCAARSARSTPPSPARSSCSRRSPSATPDGRASIAAAQDGSRPDVDDARPTRRPGAQRRSRATSAAAPDRRGPRGRGRRRAEPPTHPDDRHRPTSPRETCSPAVPTPSDGARSRGSRRRPATPHA